MVVKLHKYGSKSLNRGHDIVCLDNLNSSLMPLLGGLSTRGETEVSINWPRWRVVVPKDL